MVGFAVLATDPRPVAARRVAARGFAVLGVAVCVVGLLLGCVPGLTARDAASPAPGVPDSGSRSLHRELRWPRGPGRT